MDQPVALSISHMLNEQRRKRVISIFMKLTYLEYLKMSGHAIGVFVLVYLFVEI